MGKQNRDFDVYSFTSKKYYLNLKLENRAHYLTEEINLRNCRNFI